MKKRADDMTMQDYIFKVGTTYYFRIKVPKLIRTFIEENKKAGTDISHIIPDDLQKKFSAADLKESLQTKDYTVAKRNRDTRLMTWNTFFDAILRLIDPQHKPVEEVKHKDDPTYSQLISIPNEEIDAQFNNLLNATLLQDEGWRRDKNLTLNSLPAFIKIIEQDLRIARQALSIGDTSKITDTILDVIVKKWGYEPDLVDEDSRIRISEALLKTNIRSLELALDKSQGLIVEANKVAPKADIPKRISLDSLLDDWVKATEKTVRTVKDYTSTWLAFKTYVNNKDADKVSRRDILDWRDSLLSGGKLYYKTIVKRVRQIATIFNLAFDNERIKTNPAVRLTVKKPTILNAVREPFSEQDLHSIFTSPLFHGGKVSVGGKGVASYWLPVIALFTGAREEEIGQLNTHDFKFEHGFNFISINDLGENQSIKTMNARRMIPVHHKLVEAGLIDYVNDLRANNHKRLFPQLLSDSNGKLTANWSKWWGRYLRTVIGIEEKTKVFHSFRHNFKDALRIADINDELQNIILGHSNSGKQGSVYGGAQKLKLSAQAVVKIEYPGLEIPVLFIKGEK